MSIRLSAAFWLFSVSSEVSVSCGTVNTQGLITHVVSRGGPEDDRGARSLALLQTARRESAVNKNTPKLRRFPSHPPVMGWQRTLRTWISYAVGKTVEEITLFKRNISQSPVDKSLQRLSYGVICLGLVYGRVTQNYIFGNSGCLSTVNC